MFISDKRRVEDSTIGILSYDVVSRYQVLTRTRSLTPPLGLLDTETPILFIESPLTLVYIRM